MKKLKKSIIAMVAVVMLVSLVGCKSGTSKKNTTQKGDQTSDEKVNLVANDVYVEPLNPTNAQATAYNALSSALEKGDTKEEAKQVAISFAFDFFTLSNKKDQSDMGGLEFIPTPYIGKFKEFATSYYYGNYPTIVNTYNEDSLPEVVSVSVTSQSEEAIPYGDQTVDGYTIDLTVTYADTKLDESILKTAMTMKIIRIYDYDYDTSINYSKAYTQTGEPIEVYRVLAVE